MSLFSLPKFFPAVTAHAKDTSVDAVAASETPPEPFSDEVPAASGGVSNIFGGLVTLPQRAIEAAQWLWAAGENAAQAAASSVPAVGVAAPELSRYQRNRNEIEELLIKIEDRLYKLDGDLEGQISDYQRIMPPPPRPLPEQTWEEYGQSLKYWAQGKGEAATSALGWGAVAAGLPYVTSWVTSNLFASIAALLGAGYLGASTLRNFSSHAEQTGAELAIQAAMKDLDSHFTHLEQLIQEETLRQNARERINIVLAEREQRILQLENEVGAITNAMIDSVEYADFINPNTVGVKSPTIGNGTQRQQTLSLLASAQQAFYDLFSSANAKLGSARDAMGQGLSAAGASVGSGLSWIGQPIQRIMATPGALLDRYTTYQAETTYQNGEGKALIQALTTSVPGAPTLVYDCDIASQKKYKEACGFAPSAAEIREQLQMGEHIAHALVTSTVPTPGTVTFEKKAVTSHPTPGTEIIETRPVTSNLTTTRALAWYLDAAADVPESQRPLNAPAVQRLSDKSLLIADPDSHFYEFLMHAPTAYTVSMVTAAEQDGEVKPGVFRLHDYYQGFPRGCRGIQFERIVDNGAFALQVQLIDDPATFGIQPARIALRDDSHIVNRVRTMLSVKQEAHSVLKTEVHQHLTKDELRLKLDYIKAELERHIQLGKDERQQLQELDNWKNPNFPKPKQKK